MLDVLRVSTLLLNTNSHRLINTTAHLPPRPLPRFPLLSAASRSLYKARVRVVPDRGSGNPAVPSTIKSPAFLGFCAISAVGTGPVGFAPPILG